MSLLLKNLTPSLVFLPRSIILWNGLRSEVQESSSLSTFKSALKSHLCTWHRSHKFMHLSPSLSLSLSLSLFLSHTKKHAHKHTQERGPDKHVLASLQSFLNISINQSIRFLYKVVHKIGRLRKFNRARVIEFNFFNAWTIFIKLGTLVHHVHGYKNCLRLFNFCLYIGT